MLQRVRWSSEGVGYWVRIVISWIKVDGPRMTDLAAVNGWRMQ